MTGLIRPKQRVLTAARKEQNRLAQRAYRKRQREQRIQLHVGKDAKKSRHLQPRGKGALTANASAEGHQNQQERAERIALSQDSGNDAETTILGPDIFRADACLISPPIDTNSEVNALLESFPDQEFRTNPLFDTRLPEFESSLPITNLIVDLDDINSWPPEVAVETSAPASSLQNLAALSHPSQNLPSPFLNTLRTAQTTILSAVLRNAIALGFDLNSLMHSCQPTTFYMSPFYRSDATPSSYSSLLASSVCPDTPVNLRPALAQILIPHHASLDLIPLPRFRERAIMLTAALPQFFSLVDLKWDIYVRGALVVGNTEQPWDWSRWEAMEWFKRKWSMAVEGASCEIGL